MEKINKTNSTKEGIKNAMDRISDVVEKKLFAQHILEILRAAQRGINATYDSLMNPVKSVLSGAFDISHFTNGVFLLKHLGVLKIHPDTRDVRKQVFEQLQNYLSC